MLIGARTAALGGGRGGESAYEVEWIQKPAGRVGYLDSGVYGNKDCVLKCKVRRIDPSNLNASFFGSTDVWSNKTKDYISYCYAAEQLCYLSAGQISWASVPNSESQYEYEYSIDPIYYITVKMNGRTYLGYRSSDNGFETRWPIGFFAHVYGTTNTYAMNTWGNSRFIGHIVINRRDGTPVREFVPMVKNGVPCYFDSVNSEWYDLHNPENFEYGPPVA